MEIIDVNGRRSVLHNAQTKYKNEFYTCFLLTAFTHGFNSTNICLVLFFKKVNTSQAINNLKNKFLINHFNNSLKTQF